MSIESPAYEVLEREGHLELRRYAPYLTAQVHVSSNGYDEATSAGFRALADYIFGNNTASGSIAMTVPVTATREPGVEIAMTAPVTSERVREERLKDAPPVCTVNCAGEYVVRFTMPSRFRAVEELPTPNDPRVQLELVPEHLAVVSRFGGRLDDTSVAAATEELREWIEREGLSEAGEPEAAQYDAPWKPGFARRNEVLVPVEYPDAQ